MTYRPNFEGFRAAVNDIQKMTAEFDPLLIATFYERGARRAGRDGFRAYTSDSGLGGGSGGGGDSATEAAALAGYPDDDVSPNRRKPLPDPVGQLLDELWGIVTGEMHRYALRINDIRLAVLEVRPLGRVNTVPLCTGCNQPAPIAHMIDGKPWCCVGTPNCYRRENMRLRRLRRDGPPGEDLQETPDKTDTTQGNPVSMVG